MPNLEHPPAGKVSRFGGRYGMWLGLAGCVAILAARRSDAFVNPQFWAEDAFFFERNYTEGLRVIFQPYNGYLHLLPRLIAALSSLLDPRWIPAAYVYLSLACTLYVAARTWSARFPFTANPLYLFAVVLVPDAREVLLTPTNLQSITVAGLLLILISNDAKTWLQRFHDFTVTVILGLTGPFIVLLAPLFAIRAWARKTRWSLTVALLAGGLAAVQLGMIVLHPMPPEPTTTVASKFALPTIGVRIAGSLFLGGRLSPDDAGFVPVALAVATVVLLFVLGLRPGARRMERLLLVAGCLLLLGATIYRMRYALPQTMHAGLASRYFYTPQLIVLWLLLTAWETRPRWSRVAAASALAVILAANLPRLREPPLPDLDWEKYVPQIRSREPVVVPINPEGWRMPLNREKR